MKFCEILRALIEERGITQKQLAKDLCIAASTIGGYVQGTSVPDFNTLKRLAEYFGISSDYLLQFAPKTLLSKMKRSSSVFSAHFLLISRSFF